jgi:hypothetical protein
LKAIGNCCAIQTGKKPILVISIHERNEYRTGEINEKLQDLSYWGFIHTGRKSGVKGRTQQPLIELATQMLDEYKDEYRGIGAMSLHRRGMKRIKQDPTCLFELGTLMDCSMAPTITSMISEPLETILRDNVNDDNVRLIKKDEIRRKLAANNVKLFDSGFFQIGGAEIRWLHKKLNDKGYKHVNIKKFPQGPERNQARERHKSLNSHHNPGTNNIHIAQLEFANRIGNERTFDFPYEICKVLAESMLSYLILGSSKT